MKDYLVNIIDTLEKFVVVRAENEADAIAKVDFEFAENIMLDDVDDFASRERTVVGIASDEDKKECEFYKDED